MQSEIDCSLYGTVVPLLALYLSTRAEVLNAILESHSENEQEIKTSLLSSAKLGTKREIVSLGMQRWDREACINSAADRSPCERNKGNPYKMILHKVLCPPPGTAGKPSLAALAASLSGASWNMASFPG